MAWHLFVDESGDFSARQDAVSAGGPLLRAQIDDLRSRLEAAIPGFPWPLHAAHVNRPVVWALSAYLDRETDEAEDTVVRDVVEELRRLENPLLQNAFRVLREGRWPSVSNLQVLDTALWKARPKLMSELSRRIKQARACVARLARTLPGQLGAIVSSEASLGLADVSRSTARTGHEETDRYFDLLLAAIGRARTVAAEAGSDSLLVTILTRHVFDPAEDRLRGLRTSDVEQLVSVLPPASCTVSVQPIAVWNRNVPPACVAADLCCNVARRILGNPVLSLSAVEERLQGECGWSFRSGRPAQSHVAAVFPPGPGPWLELSAHGDGRTRAPAGIRQWAWESALPTGGVGVPR